MDFINQLPPSLREAIEQQGEESVAEQIDAFCDRERMKAALERETKVNEAEEFYKYFKPKED